MSDACLMVLAPGQSDDAPPQILVQDGDIWRESAPVPDTAGVNLDTQRRELHELLNGIMTQSRAPNLGAGTRRAIAAASGALYENVVPAGVRSELRRLADANPAEPPLLRIHVARAYEWIPWELLHDGDEFLGLRFRIARLPIIANPPMPVDRRRHAVRSVRSVLGAHLYEGEEFETWTNTFHGLLPETVEHSIVPPGAGDDSPWPTHEMLVGGSGDDILHVTCHGGLKSQENEDVYWTLDHETEAVWDYKISPAIVKTLQQLKVRHPLVFGNACASSEGSQSRLSPSLGTVFYEQGALNFVGTFAPIRPALALDFARTFYGKLLGADGPRLPIADALWATKRQYVDDDEDDPSYLFYCLYGPPDTVYEPDTAAPAEELAG
jgi:CHAT domain